MKHPVAFALGLLAVVVAIVVCFVPVTVSRNGTRYECGSPLNRTSPSTPDTGVTDPVAILLDSVETTEARQECDKSTTTRWVATAVLGLGGVVTLILISRTGPKADATRTGALQEPLDAEGGPEGARTCPWCAETIKAQAVVCRYCGRSLESPTDAAIVEPHGD